MLSVPGCRPGLDPTPGVTVGAVHTAGLDDETPSRLGVKHLMISLNDTFLRGSFPPLVTPFRDGRVDYDKFAELAERQVRDGSQGIVVAGTTGEPSSLSIQERTQLLKLAISAVGGRIQVV